MIQELVKKHQSFMELMQGLSEESFSARPSNDKWSNGENLLHILKSIKPLNQALGLPKFQLKLMFGHANRPSRSFDEVIAKYKGKLKEGGKASGKFIPAELPFEKRIEVVEKLTKTISQMAKRLSAFSEVNLDQLILPHPLLGKLTIREMIYFTIYHVEHHQLIVERNLNTHK